jgi:plasmid maintenance system antidote protein VapI
MARSLTTRYFSAAVRHLISRDGRGAQKRLAERLGITSSYLNDLIHERKAYWPDSLKDKVAEVYGFSVATLLEIGRQRMEEKK